MSKQTALQFFLTGLIDLNIGELLVDDKLVQFKELYQQAKAIEREHIEDAYGDGLNAHRVDFCTRKEYYERRYGKEASHEA